MSDDLSEYEKRRLELEQQKVELLTSIRKDLRRHQRFSNIHGLIDELDIDKHDLTRVAKYLEKRFEGKSDETTVAEDSSASGGRSAAIGELIGALTSKDVDVSVEVEHEDDEDG